MQEQLAENNDTTEKALLGIKNHIEARDKFRLGFIHRHGKKLAWFSGVSFLALLGGVCLAEFIPFFQPPSAFGLLILSLLSANWGVSFFLALEADVETMSQSDLSSYKLEFTDAMQHHPEINPHMASVAQDIMENTLQTKWYRKMKILISNLAETKKTKAPIISPNQNQIDNLFLSLAQSCDNQDILHVNASTSLEDDRAEHRHESKEICWKI